MPISHKKAHIAQKMQQDRTLELPVISCDAPRLSYCREKGEGDSAHPKNWESNFIQDLWANWPEIFMNDLIS